MRCPRFLLPLLALCFLAGTSKPKLTIRFHTEANPNSGPEFALNANVPDSTRPISISKVADISEKDVAAIYPFPAADGSLGCAFKLDNHGRVILESLSQEYHGTLLIGFVNARPVTAMLIDRRVSDGIISIPRGLAPEEVALMQKTFPTIGEKKDQKKNSRTKAMAASTPEIAVPPPLSPKHGGVVPRGD